MISLETAKKLSEFGIIAQYSHTTHLTNGNIYLEPALDQMLAEIEKRGYIYQLSSYPASFYDGTKDIYPKTYKICLSDEDGIVAEFGNMADIFSPNEATARALIWIMEQEDRP